MTRLSITFPEYDKCVDSLTEKYRTAMDEMRRELMACPIDSLKREWLDAAMRDMAAITGRLNLETESWVKKYIPKAAKDGVALSMTALGLAENITLARTQATFNGLNKRMVEAVMADLQTDLLAVTQNVERRVRNAIRGTTAEVLRRNMSQGINGRVTNKADILKDLRAKLGSTLDTGIIDAGGRRWKPESYVDMLVRTKLMEANTEGAANDAIEREVFYARISKHGAPDACGKWEDKVVKLVPDAPGNFPTLAEAQNSREVFHPRCKHLILPERFPTELGNSDVDGLFSRLYDTEAKISDPGFQEAGNHAEAVEYAKSVLGIRNPDYSLLNLKTANGCNRMIYDIQDRFGKKSVQLDTVQTTRELYQRFGYKRTPANVMGVSHYGSRSIGFTEKHFGKRVLPANDPATVQRLQKQSGWHSTDNPMHVIAHELGHQVYDRAKRFIPVGDVDECVRAYDKLRADARGIGTQLYGDRLSKYGMTNPDEYAAEAFAEYMLADNPREDAKLLGEWLKKILQGVNE